MNYFFIKRGTIHHDFITGLGTKHKISTLAGFIYAPYIPIMREPTIYDPNDFQPTTGVMTRYATTTVNNRFYGHISVSDFDSLGND